MNVQSVRDIFEDSLESQILSSDLGPCNIETLTETVNRWKKEGYTIVFTAGVFDIFTVNHLLGLYHYKLLGGDRVKLIVSIDTDERVKTDKSFVTSKGNSIKPILSWESRALMVAKQSFRHERKLVDLIVQHGSDTCGNEQCPHDDNVTIAEVISPDVIVVTNTSLATIESIRGSSHIDADRLVVINEEDLAYTDSLLGKKISTTSIIERIKYES